MCNTPPPLNELAKQEVRVGYLDALKALSIFMIVFNHVRIFSFEIDANSSAISILFTMVMVPMFFFLSGFFYKIIIPQDSSKYKWIWYGIKNKGIQLLVPTFVFFILSKITGIYEWEFPGGFWFTYVLFFMFVGTNLVVVICKQVRIPNKIIPWIILFLSLLILCVNYIWKNEINNHQINNFCSNYIYFGIGIVSKVTSYKNFKNIIRHIPYIEILFIIFVVLFIIQYREVTTQMIGVIWKVNAMILIFLLFHLFRNIQIHNYLESKLNRFVLYTGRHTLPIYMIHYFLLPILPIRLIFPAFQPSGNSIIELVMIGSVAILIISLSLIIEYTIRQYGHVANWLFSIK